MTTDRSSWSRVRRILAAPAVRIGFAVIVVVFLALAVADQWGRIGPRLHDITAGTLVASLVAATLGLVSTMLAWRELLADLGTPLRFTAVWQIFFTGQLGKYVPGSIWPVVMQMELGADQGVPRAHSAAAGLVQMGLTLATGAFIGIATVPYLVGHSSVNLVWLVLLLIVSIAALHPRVANPVLNFTFRLLRRNPLERPLSWRGLLLGAVYQSGGWLLFAVPVWLVGRDVGGSGAGFLVLCLAAFTVSWVTGFLFVIAPAGAGVRETVMIAILVHSLSASAALTVAIVSRLIMTVADALTGGAAIVGIGRDRLARLRARTAQDSTLVSP